MNEKVNKALHTILLDATVLLDPGAVLGRPGVDARFVPASAAVAPAHHASQEDPPTGAGDGQRPPGVALGGNVTVSMLPA